MEMEEIQRRAMGVRQEALSYLEQVQSPFLKEALLGMFDVKKPTPTEHAKGLLKACMKFHKLPEDFMDEWKADEEAKEMTKKTLNLFHTTVGAATAETYTRITFWLRAVVHVAEMALTVDKSERAELQDLASEALTSAALHQ